MYDFFSWLHELFSTLPPGLWNLCVLIMLGLLACGANYASKWLLMRWWQRLRLATEARRHERQLQLAVIARLANLIPALILAGGASMPELRLNPSLATVLRNVAAAFMVLCVLRALDKLLDLADLLYRKRPDSRSKPIKGFLQLGKISIFIAGALLIISTLINKNPLILLSGLGAMAAVLMLIFQDTILSLVASLQLGTNDMVRIGDWIEMPSQNADGDVIEIALHTVKVQNWDKTITTVPVRKLITDSFKNWRGMFDTGGRRIMRSLYLDQRSVRFLSDEEIAGLEELTVLNQYLDDKQRELGEWNARLAALGAKPVNQRRVTNLGTFRAYVEHYLRSLPGVNQEMIIMVRQLQPGPTGIPLQIYCFSSDTRWLVYEKVQADIFDHLLAILPVFGLRVFQEISDVAHTPMPADAAITL
ncbi:MAG: mechanosensitive ion channel [Lentisphaeria bacterium]|jgi:miniconductance mechanosensitive channel|nr:mechanosensitive ion channel [Lentisphaeria bacterium]MDY0175486.1 mechanosensitive ion channel [Lentisphaeria bacterium]